MHEHAKLLEGLYSPRYRACVISLVELCQCANLCILLSEVKRYSHIISVSVSTCMSVSVSVFVSMSVSVSLYVVI